MRNLPKLSGTSIIVTERNNLTNEINAFFEKNLKDHPENKYRKEKFFQSKEKLESTYFQTYGLYTVRRLTVAVSG